MTTAEPRESLDFIRTMVEDDLKAGKHGGAVVTRFPPEPNGYLHIGHAKAISIDFGIAGAYGGHCNLRFDDTNPVKEEQEFIDAIKRDIHWLGYDWGEHEYHASDYFHQLYDWATLLIKAGKAYVCDLTPEQVREYRGTLTQSGRESPYRKRGVDENLDLFASMKKGEFPDGARTLRAKIDMNAPNLNLRDPVMYRILHATHPRTSDEWCIYPMYDWAHGQSDWIEGVTHSLCSLEFEDHRPLYGWFVKTLHDLGARSPAPHAAYLPQQTEFNRLNLTHTVMSKRILRELVENGHVTGWDDPRMPTLSGLRRRGFPPGAIRAFCEGVGLSKRDQVIELSRLEHAVREELNRTAPRVMAVLKPLRVVIENYPKEQSEEMEAQNNPEDPAAGARKVPFAREIYIERDDFAESPPPKFFRLAPGKEVRLRAAYYVTCTGVVKDNQGDVAEVRCTYDPATRGGWSQDGRKVKGTIHWVSARHAINAEVRLYDRLFNKENPSDVPEGQTFLANINPKSLEVVTGCKVEPSLSNAEAGQRFQFERQGYFCVDPKSSAQKLIFNRTVPLRDSWSKEQKA